MVTGVRLPVRVIGPGSGAEEATMGGGTLRLERRWTSLAGTGGNALAGGNKSFTRYGWPQLLAALVKTDLWITLRGQ